MKPSDGFCPYCGITLDPNSRYCPSCGKDILQAKSNSGTIDTQPYDTGGISPQAQDTGKISPQIHATRNPASQRQGILITPKILLVTAIAFVVIIVLAIVGGATLFRPSNNGQVVVQATPTQQATATDAPTPSATDTATPLATDTPMPQSTTAANAPKAGTVLYQETGSDSWQGWTGSPDWKILNSQLLNDATNTDQTSTKIISAPYVVTGTANYAVEAKIQVQRDNIHNEGVSKCGFGIVVRTDPTNSQGQGYTAWIEDASGFPNNTTTANIQEASDNQSLSQVNFDPGINVHTYRVEVNGNNIKLLIDGIAKLNIQDNQFLAGGNVGLISMGTQLSVSNFKVIAL